MEPTAYNRQARAHLLKWGLKSPGSVRTSGRGEPVDRQRAQRVDDDARKRAGTVAATLNCPPVLRVSSLRASAEGVLPEVASPNWTVSRARWLRTSRVSRGGTSVDADIFRPHRPAAAEEECRMHVKLADYLGHSATCAGRGRMPRCSPARPAASRALQWQRIHAQVTRETAVARALKLHIQQWRCLQRK